MPGGSLLPGHGNWTVSMLDLGNWLRVFSDQRGFVLWAVVLLLIILSEVVTARADRINEPERCATCSSEKLF